MHCSSYNTDSHRIVDASSHLISVDIASRGADKKFNGRRLKSPYRDAQFRGLFQRLDDLGRIGTLGEPSVTSAMVVNAPPSHTVSSPAPTSSPLASSDANASLVQAFHPESLTTKEAARTRRFWRDFSIELPHLRQHRTPAAWRDLSDQAALEWFHHALRFTGPIAAVTVNLSPSVESMVRNSDNAAQWLSKRIYRQLEIALGRKVDCWFAFEETIHRRLHLHGEIQVGPDEAKAARKALRLAAGEWEDARQHQVKTKADPSVVWSNYSAKRAAFIRQARGLLAGMPRPIKGDWLFATNTVRSGARCMYTGRLREALSMDKRPN